MEATEDITFRLFERCKHLLQEKFTLLKENIPMKFSNKIIFKIAFLRGKQANLGCQHIDLNRAN